MIVDVERGVLTRLTAEDVSELSPLLATSAARGFDGSVIRLTTAAHESVAAATADLALLRSALADALAERHGVDALAAGLHPWSESAGPAVAHGHVQHADEMWRILGRLDPTCSLRIDVAVGDPETATRALNGLRVDLPLVLALSANSPFWRGRYTGFASARTPLRGTLSHTGMPRHFQSYADYVSSLAALIDSGAIRNPAAIDWDARLRPEDGVIEVAIADAQPRVSDVSALTALVQCLVRLHGMAEADVTEMPVPEVLWENRLAAAKKGMRADLIDAGGGV